MIRMATQPDTAARIRSVMHEKRVSQRDVAAVLNVSQTAVFRRLNGDVDFSVGQLRLVAEHLEVEPAYLLEQTPADAPSSHTPSDDGAAAA